VSGNKKGNISRQSVEQWGRGRKRDNGNTNANGARCTKNNKTSLQNAYTSPLRSSRAATRHLTSSSTHIISRQLVSTQRTTTNHAEGGKGGQMAPNVHSKSIYKDRSEISKNSNSYSSAHTERVPPPPTRTLHTAYSHTQRDCILLPQLISV